MRILLALSVSGKPRTIDMIAAMDFISVYGKTFGLTNENLHGENYYKYGEFTARRTIIKKAIRQLLISDMIDVYEKEDGYYFNLNDAGEAYCSSLNSEYANEYVQASRAVTVYIGAKMDKDVIRDIMSKSSTGIMSGGAR